MAQITELKPLRWEFSPQHIPCFVCHEEDAEARATIRHEDHDFNLLIGHDCCSLSPDEIIRTLRPITAKPVTMEERREIGVSRRPQINPDDTPEEKDPCQDTTS